MGALPHKGKIPDLQKAKETLLQDAAQRDRTTARRACLLKILWQERFLSREQLVARLEGELGKGCFGVAAWQDTFYRDMRLVKRALKAAGYEMAYSRDARKPGYYLRGQPSLAPELVKSLEGSIAEVDLAQISIYHRMSPAERFRQGCSISDAAREVVAYRIRQRNPQLSLAEANRLALQGGDST